jgi:hypothetical protein
MALLRKIIKNFLSYILAGSTMFFIAACYGVLTSYRTDGWWKITAKTSDNKPISGLRLSILEYVLNNPTPDTLMTEYTDSAGIFDQPLETGHKYETVNYAALIRDVDDTLNQGAFRDTLIPKTGDSLTVILNRK